MFWRLQAAPFNSINYDLYSISWNWKSIFFGWCCISIKEHFNKLAIIWIECIKCGINFDLVLDVIFCYFVCENFHLVKIAHQWCLHEMYLAVVTIFIEYSRRSDVPITYTQNTKTIPFAKHLNSFIVKREREWNPKINWKKKRREKFLRTITKWKWRIRFDGLFVIWRSKCEQMRQQKWE